MHSQETPVYHGVIRVLKGLRGSRPESTDVEVHLSTQHQIRPFLGPGMGRDCIERFYPIFVLNDVLSERSISVLLRYGIIDDQTSVEDFSYVKILIF